MRFLRPVHSLPLVGGLLLLAAMSVACTSGTEPSVEVRPLAEIIDGAIEITDLTAESASVRVITSVDVVCSVVFGVTEEYGRQSTDLDMAGLPHKNHAAPLRGLEPDTTYHYRLQGTASDGTLYVSEKLTFRTPVSTGAQGQTNVAAASAGATVIEVSSEFNPSTWRAANAIDGNPGTEWSSAGDGDDAFIVVELSQPTRLSSVGIWTRTMGQTAEITAFRVLTDDGTVLGPFNLARTGRMEEFAVEATAKWLRFEVVSSSGGNTGLVELAAYGEP